ncbi:MAG: hypothetical protein M8353_08720 [ANME-2 cluster archaeon]|nr:hypothetical protein [ANME-2 cluster archaeon]
MLEELTGHRMVTLITDRPVQDGMETVMPPGVYENIRIVAMGAHDDKPRHVREHCLVCFIDDRAETCYQLNAAGIRPIVFSLPWNDGRHSFPLVRKCDEVRSLCL